MKTEQSYVRIVNPETQMVDTTVLVVDEFTVAEVFAAMEARDWYWQAGTYVAIRVNGVGDDARLTLHGHHAVTLTFTVEERVVTERQRIAVPI